MSFAPRAIKATAFALAISLLASTAAIDDRSLVVCDMTERPFSLDPFANLDGKLSFALRHVLGPWIDRDEKHDLVPGIFVSWRNAQPTVWEFAIRRDLRFPDGSALTPEDVVFSIRTAIAKGSALAGEFGTIARADASGADRILVTTNKPDPTLPARFANRPFLVKRTLYESLGKSYFDAPPGVWAYRFVSIDDDALTLSRNALFPDGTKGMPKLVYRFIKDGPARIDALRNGEIDILTELTPTMSLEIAKDPSLAVVKVKVAQYVGLFFDARAAAGGIFADPLLREFMYRAIDVPRLIALAANGNGLPLATITMPEEFGYNPALKPHAADPAAAAALLSAWRAKGNGTLRLKIAVVDYLESVGKTVQGQLAKYGVEVELLIISRGDLISEVMQKKKTKVDAFIVDPQDPLLDASFQLNIETNPAYPTAFFSTPEIAELLARANCEMDDASRASLLAKVQVAVYNAFGPFPLFQKIMLYSVSRKVVGFRPLADIYLRLENVYKE